MNIPQFGMTLPKFGAVEGYELEPGTKVESSTGKLYRITGELEDSPIPLGFFYEAKAIPINRDGTDAGEETTLTFNFEDGRPDTSFNRIG